jgi:hypothetical protein
MILHFGNAFCSSAICALVRSGLFRRSTLVDDKGRVIGINTYVRNDILQPNGDIEKSEDLNFAIAVEHIKALLP